MRLRLCPSHVDGDKQRAEGTVGIGRTVDLDRGVAEHVG